MFRIIFFSLILGPAFAGGEEPVEEANTVAEPAPVVEEEPEIQGRTVYALNPGATSLKVIVRNDTTAMMSNFGHDHVIVATNPSGTIEWDPSGATPCKVSISVPTAGLTADPPGMREQVGLDNRTISSSQMKDMLANMHGKRQLHSHVFPAISYEAASCSGTEGTITVDGTMTIRGVGKAFSLPMTVSTTADEFRASGAVTLSHSDFGFGPFTAMMGALRNQDALEFRVDVQAKVSP